MKTLKNVILERLKLSNKNVRKSNTLSLDNADYIINNSRELQDINKNVFDNNTILPFIKGFITYTPIYVFETTEDDIKRDELDKLIKQNRIDNDVSEEEFKTIIPKTISSGDAVAVVLRYDKNKYTEIFIKENIGRKKMYVLLHE